VKLVKRRVTIASPFRIPRFLGYVALYLALTAGSFVLAKTAMELSASPHAAAQTSLKAALRFAPRITVRDAGLPRTLRIPRIGVEADIEQVGLTNEGAMDVPQDYWRVGWYELGPRPGEQGNAVIAGHLDTMTGAAVFARLPDLRAGDEIEVEDAKGKTRTFIVERKTSFKDEDAPLDEIFGTATSAHLNLITCGGAWDEKAGHYKERIVIFAKLQASNDS
jgi:LPXTG-site transpeptidase (sortase) family protein